MAVRKDLCSLRFLLLKSIHGNRQRPGAVVAGILPAVEDGILPPVTSRAMFAGRRIFEEVRKVRALVPPGWKPRLSVRPEARRYDGKRQTPEPT